MRTTPTPRRAAVLLATVVALALAACQPIVVTDSGVSSGASRAVDPTTVATGSTAVQAIDIRMRDCQHVQLRSKAVNQDITLRPHASVTDAAGTVVYYSHDFVDQPQVRPAGSFERANGADGAYHIVVPVAGAKNPLTIRTWCDNYTVGSHGLYPKWTFPTCTTSNRRCAASAKGDGTWSV